MIISQYLSEISPVDLYFMDSKELNDKMVDFCKDLLGWYTINKRELPWRKTKDPYAIWLSEIILQQTRVDQGLSYYVKFIEKYPTVEDFASAGEDEILKLWQGLGYYSRARNMHKTAQEVVCKWQGKFPSSYDDLLKLKGIGEYTAAAISSISYEKPHAVVDGNVYRVLSRFFGITTPIDSTTGKKEFSLLANSLMNKEKPGEYNQALMEFGALYCTPKNPDCRKCIFKSRCIAFDSSMVEKLPIKGEKQKNRFRYFNYLVILDKGSVYLKKRTGNDIWRNLYEFPLIEKDKKTDMTDSEKLVRTYPGMEKFEIIKTTLWKKQVLSHQNIYYRFIYMIADNKKNKLADLLKVNKKDIFNFAVPKPIERELEKIGME